jgi:RimJ/RimL family protein N-acetyltransferase
MLRGDRVVLRPWEREDVATMRELTQRPDFVELMMYAGNSWEPIPHAGFEKEFDDYLAGTDKSTFVIVIDGKPVGFINLHHDHARTGVAELGISIFDPAYLGQGYGREAIRLFLDWTFRIRNYHRIWLQVSAPNTRAIQSYQACGFVEEGRLRQHDYYNGQYIDIICMGLLRSEWVARQAGADSAG